MSPAEVDRCWRTEGPTKADAVVTAVVKGFAIALLVLYGIARVVS